MKYVDAVRDHFTLEEAKAFASKVDGEVQKKARDAFAQAWQKRDAAESLDAAGSFTEALRVIKESAALAREGKEALEGAGWTPPASVTRAFKEVTEALAQLDKEAPARDAEVASATRAELARLVRVLVDLAHMLVIPTSDVAELRRLSVIRLLSTAMLAVGLLVVGRLAYAVLYGVRIRAMNELNATWTADRAIDGDPNTDWVAASGDAWIELRFHAKRRFDHLRIRNGEFFPDRATKDFKVEFYDTDAVELTVTGTFTHTPAESVTFDVGGVHASRVRVTPLSHFGISAAISEILWD